MYQILVDGELFCDSRRDELAVIDPVIKLEVNSAGSFTFTIPPSHPYYDQISERISSITVYRDNETEPLFAGICTSQEDDFWKQKEITCEGELTFFNDTIQRQAYYQGYTVVGLLTQFINVHNANADSSKQFAIGSVTVTDPNDYISCYTNYETTMECLKEDLVDDLGGYFRIRHEDGKRYLDYLKESPNTNTQIIKLGENLIDYTSNLDSTEVATVIIPLGEKLEDQVVSGLDARLTIESVNNNKDYLESETAVASLGRIEQVVTWDKVTTADALKSKGQAYHEDVQFKDVSIECQAIDLHYDNSSVESFKILDKIRVISKPHGMDRYFVLTEIEYDLNNPENDKLTLGVSQKVGLSEQTRKTNEELVKRIDQVQPKSLLTEAKENATSILKSAGESGVYKILYNETANGLVPYGWEICDAADNPTTIILANKEGIGYSSDGGKTYKSAWTLDNGSFVADFIKTGKISDGDGQNKNYWDLDSGKFVTANGEIAGWTIEENDLYKLGDNGKGTGIQNPGAGTISFAAGFSKANDWSDAPFKVSHDGNLIATSAEIQGDITADTIYVKGYTDGHYYRQNVETHDFGAPEWWNDAAGYGCFFTGLAADEYRVMSAWIMSAFASPMCIPFTTFINDPTSEYYGKTWWYIGFLDWYTGQQSVDTDYTPTTWMVADLSMNNKYLVPSLHRGIHGEDYGVLTLYYTRTTGEKAKNGEES